MKKEIKRPVRKVTAGRISKKDRLVSAKVAKIVRAFDEEAEEVLENCEDAVKDCVPVKATKASLARVARKLAKEGVSARFDATVKKGLKRTAEEVAEVTVEEAQEAVDAIVDVVVDEFEALLADVDEVADTTVDEIVDELGDEEYDIVDIEEAVKAGIEKKLNAMGVKAGLARKHAKKVEKEASVKRPVRKVAKKVNPILAKARRKMSK